MYCTMAQALTHGQHPTKSVHAFTVLSTNQGKGTIKDVQVNGIYIFFSPVGICVFMVIARD